MKKLVTHINPHLDDISAIWLFKRFYPQFFDAEIEFIGASRDAALKDQTEDKVYFGTGGGRFDEHKGDTEDCATSLVWNEIKEKNLQPQSGLEVKAYGELVEWSRLIDLGKGSSDEFSPFAVQSFIRAKDSTQEGSLESLKLGEKILDRIFEVLLQNAKSELDWEGRVEFESRFGKSYAVLSENIDRSFCKQKGGDFFLMYHPKFKSAQFFTPSFEIDLEPVYKKVVEAEPDAGWFLHQSHHMVICGSGSAPQQHTELSFEQLVEIAKNL